MRPPTFHPWRATCLLVGMFLTAEPGCHGFLASPLGSSIITAVGGLLGSSPEDTSCGTDELAALVPDCPAGLVCFTSACDAHNHCYTECDVPKAVCDIEFFRDMVLICTDHFPQDDPRLARCRRLAFTYWQAVDQFGQGAFDASCPTRQSSPAPLGACCVPGPPPMCGDSVTRVECGDDRGVFFADLDCGQVMDAFGGCPSPPNDDCAEAVIPCPGQTPDPDVGVCASGGDGDSNRAACSLSAQDCSKGTACLPHDADAYRCVLPTDNRLATTDGPGPIDSCFSGDRADLWYHYVAPCAGTLTIQMCGKPTYDAVLAVYGTQAPDGQCICPVDATDLLACDDDACGGFGTVSAVTIPDAVRGACYTISVGGWSGDGTDATTSRGVSELSIGMLCAPDAPAAPATVPGR